MGTDLAVHERRLHEIEQTLDKAAEARGKAEELEERLKITLATMFVHYRNEGKSAADAKEFARASEPCRKLSEEWIAANYEWRRQEAKAKANEHKIDVWRTMNAMERAKMNLR